MAASGVDERLLTLNMYEQRQGERGASTIVEFEICKKIHNTLVISWWLWLRWRPQKHKGRFDGYLWWKEGMFNK